MLVLVIASLAVSASDLRDTVYVGTYTDKASKGIYSFRFDPNTGDLGQVELVAETSNPSFLTVDQSGKFLYAVNELDIFDGNVTGAISTFAVNRESAKLTQLQQVSSAGAGPAYVSIDRSGRYILVANYDGGNIAVFRIQPDGRLGPRTAFVQHAGSSVNKERQTTPHAHQIEANADNRFVFVADLGIDELAVYRFDEKTGALTPNKPAYAKVSAGAGPRHFSISPSGKFVYLVNEMSSTVTVFDFDATSGKLREKQTISTLPKDFHGDNTTAEIAVDRAGKFLYVSNRGDDSIAVLAIDPQDGKLSFVDRTPTGGKTPRHFALDPTGKWLFAANQDSDTINLFSVDSASGRLTSISHTVRVPDPVCVVFVPEN
jgi:6-phosphogluconolactonase